MQPVVWEVPRADPVSRALQRDQKAGRGSCFFPKWWQMSGTWEKWVRPVPAVALYRYLWCTGEDAMHEAAPLCRAASLVAAAAWEHGWGQGLFPTLSWHTAPRQSRRVEKSSFACGLPRWFAAEPPFGNCSEKHCTTFHVLCLAEGPDRQVALFCPAPLKDFHVCRSPFSFILLLAWRGYVASQGG